MFGLEPNVVSLLGQNIVIYTNAKALRGREARIEQVFITQASHFSAKYRQSFGLHCDGCATINGEFKSQCCEQIEREIKTTNSAWFRVPKAILKRIFVKRPNGRRDSVLSHVVVNDQL
jgi:hypothetical protein